MVCLRRSAFAVLLLCGLVLVRGENDGGLIGKAVRKIKGTDAFEKDVSETMALYDEARDTFGLGEEISVKAQSVAIYHFFDIGTVSERFAARRKPVAPPEPEEDDEDGRPPRVVEADPYGLKVVADSFPSKTKSAALGWQSRFSVPNPLRLVGSLLDVDAARVHVLEDETTGEVWVEVHETKKPPTLMDRLTRAANMVVPVELETQLPPAEEPEERYLSSKEVRERYGVARETSTRLLERYEEPGKKKGGGAATPTEKVLAQMDDGDARVNLLMKLARD